MLHRLVLVALGANLPGPDGRTPQQTCEWAVARLRTLPGLSLQARSHWYRSAPVPASTQPDYINGVVRLWGRTAPHEMLAALQTIEACAGRARSTPNAARTLDLDLLAIDAVELDTPDLIIPHPRLPERGFVLAPLAEIAPDWVHPHLHRSARELLLEADLAGVERLPWTTPAPVVR